MKRLIPLRTFYYWIEHIEVFRDAWKQLPHDIITRHIPDIIKSLVAQVKQGGKSAPSASKLLMEYNKLLIQVTERKETHQHTHVLEGLPDQDIAAINDILARNKKENITRE